MYERPNINSPYTNIIIDDYDPYCGEITKLRDMITTDIIENPKNRNKHMIDWYSDKGWHPSEYKHTYNMSSVVYDNNNNFIGMSTSIIIDNTLKVLVKYYLMSEYASQYRGISQTDIIPHHARYARENNMEYIWKTVHTFDKRHKKLSESIKKKLNGSGVPREAMPYYDAWKFVGIVNFQYVDQDKFVCEIY
tara:strand:+ start:651 stop:1226 length:576 start_codon:yes stop_codon:yes gene_type:complete